MNSSYYRFSLEMQSVQSQVSIPASLYDTARSLYINFTDGGKPYSIATGCLAKLSITRPSGSKLHEFCAIEGHTTVIYSFSQNKRTVAEEGIHECEVTLYGSNGEQITSPRFTMIVSERVVNMDDDNGLDEESIGIVDEIVRQEMERQAAEDVRATTEAGRASAEEGRVEAEERRVATEESRKDAELGRVEAEESRAIAEEGRAESLRQIELATATAIDNILSEQEGIMALQNALMGDIATTEQLAKIIALQESYIGGGTE